MDNMQVMPMLPGAGPIPLVTPLSGKTAGMNGAVLGAGLSFADLLGAVAVQETLPAGDAVKGAEPGKAPVESPSAENAEPMEEGKETEVSLPVMGATPLPQVLPVMVQHQAEAVAPAPLQVEGDEPVKAQEGILPRQEQAVKANGKPIQPEVQLTATDGMLPSSGVPVPAQPLLPSQKEAVAEVKLRSPQKEAVVEAAAPVILPREAGGVVEKLPEKMPEKLLQTAAVKPTGWVSKPAESGEIPQTTTKPETDGATGHETSVKAQVPTAGNIAQPPSAIANAVPLFAPVAAPQAGEAEVVSDPEQGEEKQPSTATGDRLENPETEQAMAVETARVEAPRGRETVARQLQDRVMPGDSRDGEAVEGRMPTSAMDNPVQGQNGQAEMKTPVKSLRPEIKDSAANTAAGEKSVGSNLHYVSAGEPLKMSNSSETAQKGESTPSVSAESILNQVKDTLAQHNPKEAKQITMTLNPAELGELKINVTMEGQRLKVEVTAENATVRDVLLANVDSLKESLSKQNVTMERFNVSTGGNYTFNQHSSEERWVPQNNHSYKNYTAQGSAFAEGDERKVSYLTGTGQGLVDVRF